MHDHPTLSPAGAAREHAVPCHACRRPTWNHEALCDTHLPLVSVEIEAVAV